MAEKHQYGISDFNHVGLMVEFKAATRSDFPFCWNLYQDFMQPLARSNSTQSDRQYKARMRKSFFSNHAAILIINGKRAGWLELEEDDEAVHMHQLHLLPEYQRLGIASNIIDQIFVIAADKSKCVKLEVLKKNKDAYRLYKRLGFRVVMADTQKYFMSTGNLH